MFNGEKVYFDSGSLRTPIYSLSQLPGGTTLAGPVIIMQDVATVVVEPGCQAYITHAGNIEILVIGIDGF